MPAGPLGVRARPGGPHLVTMTAHRDLGVRDPPPAGVAVVLRGGDSLPPGEEKTQSATGGTVYLGCSCCRGGAACYPRQAGPAPPDRLGRLSERKRRREREAGWWLRAYGTLRGRFQQM
ncbi:hypothetical protein NDU88_002646 [Pleurodeles waltl]|uniref:Uncharacterized protein n=1 Tax=Pleurodeles waltl TaxID=8319 RepID=A0AAV7M8S7_PLEWA|nr:hypothetical protein NDU88_002646 [Pleurodeles waltl]